MWDIDFRATQHTCHEGDAFIHYEQYKNQQVVYLLDNLTSSEIKGHLDVTVRL